jgi:hypothetical protein
MDQSRLSFKLKPYFRHDIRDGAFLQSLHHSFRLLAKSLHTTKVIATTLMITHTGIMTGFRVLGLTRLLTVPSGANPAGNWHRSIPGNSSAAIVVIECRSRRCQILDIDRRFWNWLGNLGFRKERKQLKDCLNDKPGHLGGGINHEDVRSWGMDRHGRLKTVKRIGWWLILIRHSLAG